MPDTAERDSTAPALSIVIVSWNVRDLLRACLRSVTETAGSLRVETIVVDNASADGSAEMVRREFPDVTLAALAENAGFAAGNNRGIGLSHGRHVLALNPDVVVRPGALQAMVARLDADPRVGAVGARQLTEDGEVRASGRAFPTFAAMLGHHTFLRVVPCFRRADRRQRMKDFPWDREAPTDALAGAALAVRRSVLNEIGGWDERFFLFYEDVDLCRRIRGRGYVVLFLPDAEVVHLGGRSTEQSGARQVMLLRSMLQYFDKHAGRGRTRFFRFLFKPAYVLTMLLRLPVEAVAALLLTLTGRPDRARRRLTVVRHAARFLAWDVWKFLWM